MNALVADYLDRGFRREGYTGIDELPLGFADYLLGDRKPNNRATVQGAPQPDIHDEPEDTEIRPFEFT